MVIRLTVFLILLMTSKASPQAPPPPPGSSSSSSVTSSQTSVPAPPLSGPPTTAAPLVRRYDIASTAPATTWVYDSNCPADTPPFGLGKWIEVTETECPIAFSDPTFYEHSGVCNNPSLGELYPFGVETMYTWDTSGGYAPLCQYTPSCLACPALLNCADGSNDGCECNGDLDSNGKGECNSSDEGGPFCYVDSDSTCGDLRAQYFFVWGGDSGLRYLSNEACNAQTDLSGYARNS